MNIMMLGWFKDLKQGDPQSSETLREHVGEIDDPELREQIASYLDAGVMLTGALGTRTYDELSSEHREIGPSKVLTDGEMVWPSDLGYYVRVYGLGLPVEAVATMRRHNWTVPSLTPLECRELTNRAFGFG